MPIDASIPLQAAKPMWSLSDLLQQNEQRDLRDQQMQIQQQQAARQQMQFDQSQQARGSLADLINSRGANGAYDTKGPAFQNYAKADPEGAFSMLGKLDEQQHAQAAKRVEAIGQAALLADTPEKWDQAVGWLSQVYPEISQYKGQFSPQVRQAAIAAAGQAKAYLEQTKPVSVGPGTHLVDPSTGKPIFSAPFKPEHITVGEGQKVIEYQPGGGQSGQSSSADLSVEGLRPHFVAQESSGNYSAVNRETGAMGAYQVMPQTGQALAGQLGLPWHPELMTASTPEAKAYQDKIGGAAIQEAVTAGGGDPGKTFSYYYGGPDQSKWGPRTRQYASEMTARLGQDGGARVIAQGPPKQAKGQWQQMSPQEVQEAGLPAGVYQRSPDGEIKAVAGTTGKNAQPTGQAYSQSAMDAFDRAIGSANRLLKHPGFKAAVGSGFDPASWGSFNPVTGSTFAGTDAQDFKSELDAMKAQVFLPMVQSMKGMGALSNAEGEKLTAAIGAMDTKMSEGAFRASLNRIMADLNKYKRRAMQPAQSAPASGGSKPSVSNW